MGAEHFPDQGPPGRILVVPNLHSITGREVAGPILSQLAEFGQQWRAAVEVQPFESPDFYKNAQTLTGHMLRLGAQGDRVTTVVISGDGGNAAAAFAQMMARAEHPEAEQYQIPLAGGRANDLARRVNGGDRGRSLVASLFGIPTPLDTLDVTLTDHEGGLIESRPAVNYFTLGAIARLMGPLDHGFTRWLRAKAGARGGEILDDVLVKAMTVAAMPYSYREISSRRPGEETLISDPNQEPIPVKELMFWTGPVIGGKNPLQHEGEEMRMREMPSKRFIRGADKAQRHEVPNGGLRGDVIEMREIRLEPGQEVPGQADGEVVTAVAGVEVERRPRGLWVLRTHS